MASFKLKSNNKRYIGSNVSPIDRSYSKKSVFPPLFLTNSRLEKRPSSANVPIKIWREMFCSSASTPKD